MGSFDTNTAFSRPELDRLITSFRPSIGRSVKPGTVVVVVLLGTVVVLEDVVLLDELVVLDEVVVLLVDEVEVDEDEVDVLVDEVLVLVDVLVVVAVVLVDVLVVVDVDVLDEVVVVGAPLVISTPGALPPPDARTTTSLPHFSLVLVGSLRLPAIRLWRVPNAIGDSADSLYTMSFAPSLAV